MKKNDVVFVIGNFGVGKSTLIRPWFGTVEGSTPYTCLSEYDGWEILGSDIGADSLSKYKKADVLAGVMNAGIDLIVAGIYYQKLVDIDRFKETHNIHCIYLKTSKETNMARVAGRGGKWNEDTYKCNSTNVKSFVKKIEEGEGHECYYVNNEKPKEELSGLFGRILANIEMCRWIDL